MFCKNCGKEVADGAYVCTGCGCLVQDTKNNVLLEETKKAPSAKITLLLKIFLMISISCAVLGIACYAIAVALAEGYVYIGSYSSYGYASVYPNFGWCLFALCYSFCHLGTAIPAFIFGLKEKQEQGLKFISLLNFIASIILFATSLLVWILSANNL